MTRRLRAPVRSERGSAIAEMAVIAPLLLLLLIGVVEVGRYAHYSILVAGAARAGVQYGSQNLVTAADLAGMQTAALNDGQNDVSLRSTASQFCKCADGTASTCLPTDCSASHRLVYVQVDAFGTFQSLLHYPGIRGAQALTTRAIMRVAE